MSRLTIDPVPSGYNLTKINENFDKIEAVINDELLHRVNTNNDVPNSLEVDLDANSRRIYNLPAPISGGEPIRLKDLFGDTTELLKGPKIQHIIATENQTLFTLTNSYTPGTDSMYVFRNGIYLTSNEYVETSSNSVTINESANAGDVYSFVPVAVSAGAGGGSSDTNGTNVGTGTGVYKTKSGNTLQFKTIKSGGNISISATTDEITIAGTAGSTTAQSVGTGAPVYKQTVGDTFQFRSIVGGNNVSVVNNPNDITISATAANVTASNLGSTGEGVFSTKVGDDLRFKRLVAGSNVTLSNDSNTITINSSGGGGGSSGIKIVAATDSLGAQQALLDDSWPVRLQDNLRASGADANVVGVGINGFSYYRANTDTTAFNGKTMRQVIIENNPAIVLVALGFNDAVMGVDGRSLAQIQADALDFYSAIRAALPSAKIIYLSQLPYDSTHGAPATLINRQVLPFHMKLPSTGILAGCYCSEIMADPCSSAVRTSYGTWVSLDTYIKGLSQIDANYTLPLWKASRLGLTGHDGLHYNAAGSVFLAAAVRKAFNTLPALTAVFPNLSNQNYPLFNDPDQIFTEMVTDNGIEWATIEPSTLANHTISHYGPWKAENAAAWFMPSKGSLTTSSRVYETGSTFVWQISGSQPLSQVYVSYNGGAWAAAHSSTDAKGDLLDAGVLPLSIVGSYVFRYKVKNEIYGPITLNVVIGGGVAWTDISGKPKFTTVASVANLVGGTQSVTSNFKTRIRFKQTNSVTSPGSYVTIGGNDANGATLNYDGNTNGAAFLRAQFTVLVTGGVTNQLYLCGFDVYENGVYQYSLQGTTYYPPGAGYAGEIGINFVGRFDHNTEIRPWIFGTGACTLQDSGSNGFGTYMAIEYLCAG